MNNYKDKNFSMCEKVDTQFFLNEGFEFMHKLFNSNFGLLLDLGNTCYLRIVRLLYANLAWKHYGDLVVVESRVKNVKIVLDSNEFCQIFQLTPV